MGRLDGKVSLVLGGAGYVGEGIVRSFLEEGAFVIVPSRSQERLNGLRKLVGGGERLVTVPANVGSPQGAESLKTQILTKMGRLDAVVASLGGWWQGAQLIDLSIDELGKVLNDNLISHFVAAKAFIPALTKFPGSSYTMIAGLAGEIPMAGSGPVSIAMAAQQAMQPGLAELVEELRVFRAQREALHPLVVSARELPAREALVAALAVRAREGCAHLPREEALAARGHESTVRRERLAPELVGAIESVAEK